MKSPRLLKQLLAVFLVGMTGCAWIQSHQTQIISTLKIVGNRVAIVATQTLLNAAESEADANFKANFADAIAAGLRSQETSIVSSDDIAKIIADWSPNDGGAWETIGAQSASIAAQALAANDKPTTAQVVEQIAVGMNTAAANLRKASLKLPAAKSTGTAQ